MANEKIKDERYQQFGGLNQKASPYVMTNIEFLGLANLDFQTVGALTQRWGSTQYVSQTFGSPITSLYEFARLDGSSYVVVGASGALWSGATTGQSQGLSLTYQGVTLVDSAFFADLTSTVLGAANKSSTPLNYQGNAALTINKGQGEFAETGCTLYSNAENLSSNKMSFATFQNYLFMADGNVFLKYNGLTTSFVGLPPATWSGGITLVFGSGSTFVGLAIGNTSVVGFYASYVNQRGFEGPIWPLGTISMGGFVGSTAAALGGTYAAFQYGIATPFQYDIASINLYSFANPSLIMGATFWIEPYVFLSNTPVTAGSTTTYVTAGSGVGRGQTNMFGNIGTFPANPNYLPIGLTLIVGTGATAGLVTEVDMINYSPQYLEIFQNRLFLAGFSLTPSTVWFSDAGEPEGYQPNWNFEVRTNDADVVTALKTYLSNLYIFKKNSFHALSGDNPLNFFLQQQSFEYGCLNNRCTVTFEQNFAFLDRKGLMSFNGANLTCLSTKVQPTFDSMNYSAALSQACVTHDKLRNQVLIGIPINGATLNNITMVYDYLINEWTTYNSFNPSIFATIQGRNNTKNAFYGSYSGTINWFSASFLADNGTGFTTYMKPAFSHEIGESTQKQFRHLFMNIDPPSTTLVFGLNYFQDYGSSQVIQSTMVIGTFQTRNDFGISGKSMTFELSLLQTNSPLRIHGFTISERMQREV